MEVTQLHTNLTYPIGIIKIVFYVASKAAINLAKVHAKPSVYFVLFIGMYISHLVTGKLTIDPINNIGTSQTQGHIIP